MNTVTDLRSFLRGVSFDNESYLDQLKTVDNIIIDMCSMVDVFEQQQPFQLDCPDFAVKRIKLVMNFFFQ